MSRTLTLKLSDDAYNALQRQAEAAGASPDQFAADSLERQLGSGRLKPDDAEALEARRRFERHFGEVDFGTPTGADNESIDSDLAREYEDPHEEV